MALATRLNRLGLLSDWNYRSIVIDLGRQGYRSGEPVGVERETSTILAKVLAALWSKGLTKKDIADNLNLPWDEVEMLFFGLAAPIAPPPIARPLSVVKLVKFDLPPSPMIKGLPSAFKIVSPFSFCKTGSIFVMPPLLEATTLGAGILSKKTIFGCRLSGRLLITVTCTGTRISCITLLSIA